MKIKAVHIDGFGKWQNQDFVFTDNPVLIYGPNEAGKTTLAAFILSILFGFADGRGKNKYQQYIPKTGAAYGGSLTVTDGQHQYVIKRVKGKNGGKVTITNEEGKKEPASFLTEFIGPLDRDLYQAIYSFSQSNLLNDELDRKQLEQQLQRLGAVGSREWLKQIAQLEKSADELYKIRGRKPQLNQHLKEYDELRDRLNQAQAQSSEYHEAVTHQKSVQHGLEELTHQQPKLKQKVERSERLQRLWPVYQQWQDHQRQLTSQNKLTDEQVVKIQELQSHERELQAQQVTVKRQLVEQAAIVKERSISDVEDFRQNQAHYQQLKDDLLALRIQENSQSTTESKKWQTELQQLTERYGSTTLPAPLSERAVGELEELLNREGATASNSQNLFVPGIGFVLFIVGLIVHQPVMWILGIVALLAACYWWFSQQQLVHRREDSRREQLRQFGQQYGLASFPTEKWLAMQGDLHRYQDLQSQLKRAGQAQENYQQQLTGLKRQLPSMVTGDSLSELVNGYNRWLVEHREKAQQLASAEQELARIKQQQASVESQLTQTASAKKQEYQLLGITTDAEFKQLQTQRVAEQTKKVTTAAYEQQLTSTDRQQLAKFHDRDELAQAVNNAHQKLAANQQEQTSRETTIAQLKVQIDSLVKNGSFSELNQQLSNLQTTIWEETKEWLSLQFAIRWINGALKLASQDRYPQILQQAEKYFAILTGNRYQKIMVTDDGISVLNGEQQIFATAELSLGTAEQLFISLRLGFIMVISDQIHLPIMIDDGFVNFDNVRRGRMLDLLQEMAKNNQVIYFTANDRLKKLGSPVLDLDELNKNK